LRDPEWNSPRLAQPFLREVRDRRHVSGCGAETLAHPRCPYSRSGARCESRRMGGRSTVGLYDEMIEQITAQLQVIEPQVMELEIST
jgi:hypothetical protein